MADETQTEQAGEATSLAEIAAEQEKAKAAEAPKTDAPATAASAEPTAAPAGEAAEADQEDPLQITKYYDETKSRKRAAQLKDDDAFFDWVDNMESLVGRRDEDAQLGKQIRAQLAEKPLELARLLAGDLKTPEKPSLAKDAEDTPEFDVSWITENEKGELVPAPGAPSDVAVRYRRYLKEMQATPKEVRGLKEQLSKLEKRLEENQEKAAEERQNTAVDAFCDKHRKVLFVDGEKAKGLTAQGEQVLSEYERLHGGDAVALLESSVDHVLARQPKLSPGRPSPKATRQPALAAKGPAGKTVDQRLLDDQGNPAPEGTLAEMLKEASDAAQEPAGV